jgi:hypothetical protein
MPSADTRPPLPREAIAVARRRSGGARAVGSFVPALTTKAFRRFGFSAASLITDWPAIAGRDLARLAVPERLKWPRSPDPADEDAAGPPPRRRGATLVLRVDGGRALEIEYGKRQIIERVNAYLGYPAIADLRIVQAPVAQPPTPQGATRRPPQPLTHEVSGIADAGLRGALARLGAEVKIAR